MDCTDVLPEEIGEIKEKLEQELKRSAEVGRSGIGLSAPQIGIPRNMAIVRIPASGGMIHSVDLVNCRIDKGFDEAEFLDEGCLSFPGKYVTTRRYQEIYVVENAVEPFRFIATALFSIVVQHELNHLQGILLPDLDIRS